MNQRFVLYSLVGQGTVDGWLEAGALTVIKVLDTVQRSKGISGSVAEIGVHHGKLFIALNTLQRRDEYALAIDVFGDQELNIDKSGQGDLRRFKRNLRRWSSDTRVVIHQGDSAKLSAAEVITLAHSRVRLFSVDGGHTAELVLSDMTVAEMALCAGGIVIADDVFNEFWPGVATGTFRYLQRGGLRPFAIGFNKVFFSSPDFVDYYRESLISYFDNKYPLVAKISELDCNEVVVVGRVFPRPRQIISRSKTAKSLYHRIRPTH